MSGSGDLGAWGRLELTGVDSARVRSAMSEDFDIPSEVAGEILAGVLVLSDELGRVLILPYAGDFVACIDLGEGGLLYPMLRLLRSAEHGLRMASVRLLSGVGVLHLTEGSLCLFDEELELVWRCDKSFMGWSIEGVLDGKVLLLASDWAGRESRQAFSLRDGRAT